MAHLGPTNVAIALAILTCIWFLWRKADAQLEHREPPIVLSNIPFIGHIIGMMRYQSQYYQVLSSNTYPIFTLKTFNTRIYIVRSPRLVSLIFRDSKTFTFDQFSTAFTRNALGAPPHVMEIVQNTRYMDEIHHEMYGSLSIGPGLLESNSRILNTLSRYLNSQETYLYDWLRESYTIAAGETLYGYDNPVPDLINAIWDFEEDLGVMMIGPYPSITARKAYRGHQLVSKAFTAYYEAGLDNIANELIKGRARAGRKFGIDNTTLGRFEIAMCFASVTNVVPTVFWMLSHIYSDQALLWSLREEIAPFYKATLDITKLRSCPLLISTFQETQRLYQHGNTVRFVGSDTLLDEKYLIKRGSIVQIPGSVLHTASTTWGPDSKTFDARRFLGVDDRKARQQSFISFGGGKHLCPGRHLAFTETLGFVAAFVLGFDMEGARILTTRTHRIGFGTRKPKGDLKVSITRRAGYKDVKWAFDVGDLAGWKDLAT